MSGRAPYFGPSGDCRIAAGEILNVKVTIRESRDGADVDITGRTFALSIYRAMDEGEIYSTSAVGVGTSAILSADGDTTRGWRDQYQGVPLRIMVVELFDGGFSTLSDGGLNVVAASRSLVPGENQPTDTGPVVQIVFVEASNQSLYLAIGAPGRPNSLAIGTVSALPPGGTPTVSITGAAPSQTLDFGIPIGGFSPSDVYAIVDDRLAQAHESLDSSITQANTEAQHAATEAQSAATEAARASAAVSSLQNAVSGVNYRDDGTWDFSFTYDDGAWS